MLYISIFRELCQDIPKGISPCSCISADYEWVTVITVHKAEGLVKPGRWSGIVVNVTLFSVTVETQLSVRGQIDPVIDI